MIMEIVSRENGLLSSYKLHVIRNFLVTKAVCVDTKSLVALVLEVGDVVPVTTFDVVIFLLELLSSGGGIDFVSSLGQRYSVLKIVEPAVCRNGSAEPKSNSFLQKPLALSQLGDVLAEVISHLGKGDEVSPQLGIAMLIASKAISGTEH